MKKLNKVLPIIFTSCLLTTAAFAEKSLDKQSSEYRMNLYNDCQLIAQHAMNQEQVNAYLALKAEEKKMAILESPIEAIEQQLEEYSDKIEQLNDLAFQESNGTLQINKKYLKQQKHVAKQLSHLMSQHQDKFDALGAQGNLIGKVAKTFTTSLATTLGDVKYDQLHISAPGENKDFYCYNK